MHIIVNNKPAVLKTGTSVDYVSENRLFSGSDGYTLSITFPLKGCPENIAIFGHINRADVTAQKVVFDCEIRDRNFCKFGSVVITEISETEVKTQFLEGRSEQNFNQTFDKVFVNELALGTTADKGSNIPSPSDAWNPILQKWESVALPWWEDNSSAGNTFNFATYSNGKYAWEKPAQKLTWQPYLLFITKRICDAIGYEYDFSAWEDDERYRYLLICNALPGAWEVQEYARALPHWTIDEYFEKLELFLDGEFEIDHRGKKISFAFTEAVLASKGPVYINNLVDEHSIEVADEDNKCDYRETKNLIYKASDTNSWKYYSCDWFIKHNQGKAVSYNTLDELLADNRDMATWNTKDDPSRSRFRMGQLLYAEDVETYFIIRTIKCTDDPNTPAGRRPERIYTCVLQPVNILGGRIVNDSKEANSIDIEFVPVLIEHTDDEHGYCMFLSPSSFSETPSSGSGKFDPFDSYFFAEMELLSGEKENAKPEYYDRIYVGFWDGALPANGKMPHPHVADIEILDDWSSYNRLHFSLRLNDKHSARGQVYYRINPKQKATFKFIADNIPDVRALYFINGKKYICEKITATFTENGMSQLLKGDFYPVAD